MASVAIREVRKSFGTAEVIHGVDIAIDDGQFVVLVGPSGCGKSTLLRMIAGLENVTAGEIRIGERVVNHVPPKERDIAMVFQNYALYPHMSVFGNMAYGLKIRGLSKSDIAARVGRAADILQLDKLLDRKPRALSGGQRQRVAMGRAIVRDPQVFLFDEPLSNLDAKLRVQMRVEIARLQRDLDATTLYVTHDQVEAMTMGDRVAVMRRGELQQCEAPQQLYDRPTNLFVASFIGSPAMNLVQVEIRADGGGGLLCRAAGSELRLRGELSALRLYAGRKVALGVRPEHLRRADGEGGLRLTGTVVLTESLGSTLLVHADVEGAPVTTSEVLEGLVGGDPSDAVQLQGGHGSVRVISSFEPDGAVHQGERVELALDPRRLHFFDLETGHAIR